MAKTVNHKKIKLFILLGVLIYAGFTFMNQQSLLNSQLAKQQELLATESQLKADEDYKQNELSYIGTDEYIIKKAREKLGWLFQDETKYVEVPSASAASALPSETASATPSEAASATPSETSSATPSEAASATPSETSSATPSEAASSENSASTGALPTDSAGNPLFPSHQ